MIKNTSAPRIQIEVHEDYWDNVCDNEMISDPDKRKERKEKEKRDIIEFCLRRGKCWQGPGERVLHRPERQGEPHGESVNHH